ncbi:MULTISPECIES: hypothetical protein [Vibrio harveyi group]|uniref:hypothetical protein n=1 Tax=Vibrio harveyi group TaxID=717610 RepID=UPI0003F825E5|nr:MULTISPECIES: hypothetical protein [Vibrio harveyi group]AOV89708.1 hypothetical protein FORC23_1165 [Vibrio parahaemolyticus]EJC1445640.1 hypothetical protein [Vibrio parahaemolyticus]EJI1394457.1 hypothetical protein [Vibrio parahaemolyticus]MBT0115221.1 hypothetical protein [Vibrio alginolyticus]
MAKIFSTIWLTLRDLAKTKSENPDDEELPKTFNSILDIAKQREPESYEEFKDK